MTDVIPERLLASLTEAPPNRWVALDLVGMRVLDCSDDLAAAIRIMKDQGLLAPLIWCPAIGFPGILDRPGPVRPSA